MEQAGQALEIEITSGSMSAADLRAALESMVPAAEVQFDERPPQFRVVETAVVVALVSGGASALTALITGAFTLAAAHRAARRPLVIRGRTSSIEVPPGTPASEIPRLVELARELDDPVVELP